MAITVEAVYENGVLKPSEPLPFKEHEKVRVSVEPTRPPIWERIAALTADAPPEELAHSRDGSTHIAQPASAMMRCSSSGVASLSAGISGGGWKRGLALARRRARSSHRAGKLTAFSKATSRPAAP